MYIILCQFYLNVISKLHACTFVTCSLNVIEYLYASVRTARAVKERSRSE